jgi:hypothetical protein
MVGEQRSVRRQHFELEVEGSELSGSGVNR